MHDRQAQEQVNEAAEKFASAIKESYQALADRSVSAQELNAQLTQNFFNGVINNLRTQAENNRALAQDLIEQQRKQQEASQALTQESLNAYMDFLNSMFALPRQGAQTAGQVAREAGPERSTEPGREEDTTEADAVRHPLGSWVPTSPNVHSPPGLEEQAPREEPPPGEERPERRVRG
jgi:polyhydroxyalkanoate synthesis regulator phasin